MFDGEKLRFWRNAVAIVFGCGGFAFGVALPIYAGPDPGATLSGKVFGPVVGPHRFLLPGATVLAIRSETGVKEGETTSDRFGEYQLEDLRPGTYNLVACHSGAYKPDFQKKVLEDDKPPYTQDFYLDNLEKKTGLKVTVIDPTGALIPSADVSLFISQCEISRSKTTSQGEWTFSPIPDAQHYQVAAAAIGFEKKFVPVPPNERDVTVRLNLAAVSTAVTMLRGGPEPRVELAVLTPSERVTKTEPALHAEPEPEIKESTFARAVPTGIALRSQLGTNQIHGTLHYAAQNDALDARNFFNLPGFEKFRKQVGGFTLGGPLKRDRLFFFVNYDLSRAGNAPTFSPILISQLGLLNQQLVRLGLPPEDPHRFVSDSAQDILTARLDSRLSQNHYISISYTFERDLIRKELVDGPFATSALPSMARDISGRFHGVRSQHRWETARRMNEFRYSYSPISLSIQPTEPGEVSLLVPGLVVLGRGPDPEGQRLTRHVLTDDVALDLGKHTLKFGALFGFERWLNRLEVFQAGRAVIPSLSALSAPMPITDLFELGAGGKFAKFSKFLVEGYIEDAYKLRPRFTLNFGVRYKAEFPPSLSRNDTRAVQPRVGIAWDVTGQGKTTLRMGYGVYRDRLPPVPFVYGRLIGGGLEPGPPPVRTVTSFVGNAAATNALSVFLNSGSTPPGPQLAVTLDPAYRSSYTETATIELDRQFPLGVILSASYVYTRGTALLTATNVNLGPPTVIAGRPDFGGSILNPAFAQIYQFQSEGTMRYHGLQLQGRVSHSRLSLSANYSYGRSIDDAPEWNLYPFEATPQNVFNRRDERATSDGNKAHRAIARLHWDFLRSGLPGPQQVRAPLWHRLIGELYLETFSSIHSGQYLNVVTGFDANHDGNPLTDRPLQVGRNTFLGPRFAQVDMRLAWRPRPLGMGLCKTERCSTEFTVDVFNILNHTNFAGVSTVLEQGDLTGLDPRIVSGRRAISGFDYRQPLAPSGFGLATSAFTPRRLKLGLSFSF
jgi:hypothetical protein